MEMLEQAAGVLTAVRKKKPLVHHITNYVTVNDCANIALALGASPVMADDIGEVEEMVSLAAALVINMGTMNTRTIKSMLAAGKRAKERNVPIVFDPVGVGATTMRTLTAAKIINEVKPDVIRGNMAEIKLLAGLKTAIRGVDSVDGDEDGKAVAITLANKLRCVVAITGKRDVIAGGEKVYVIDNGHSLLASVTGTGCMATTLVGGCCGVVSDLLVGAVAGIMIMGLAGEIANKSLEADDGLGMFRVRLFDAVSKMTSEIVLQGGRVSEG
ncbi:MAG: Hydroxyethylthiazole kinase [Firmicutes bacterium]|nr:Hydroxyethylthiazole kinase [Bacillota bacterium]